MTVKSLTLNQKKMIAEDHVLGFATIDQQVVLWNRSRRTIIRVLEEAGCTDVVKRRVKRATTMTIPTKTPWWKKVFEWVFPKYTLTDSRP